MIGDKQHFAGYNKKILEDGIGEGVIEEREEYIFVGKHLKEALENSIEPYFTGFVNSTPFLESLSLKPEMKFEELSEEERKRLLSALTIKLIEQGVDDIQWKKLTYYGKSYGKIRKIFEIPGRECVPGAAEFV